MHTSYPFRLPDDLIARLPHPGADGLSYIDVKVSDTWDGILVVNAEGNCIGIHLRRRVEEYPLPFEVSQIQDVRPACFRHRVLAQVPFDSFEASLLTVFAVSPVLLVLSRFVFAPLSAVSAVACLIAIYSLYRLPGFWVFRPLAALVGLAQAVLGASWFAHWALR